MWFFLPDTVIFDDLYEIMQNKDVRYLLKSEEYDVLIQNVADAFREDWRYDALWKKVTETKRSSAGTEHITEEFHEKEYLAGRKEVKKFAE